MVADGVVRLGSSLVNWYLVEADDGITIVDAGLPGYWPQLAATLGVLGRELTDIAAVVLTHGHVDHIGVAERLRSEAGARILVHQADEQLVLTGEQPPRERGMLPYLWRPAAIRLFMHLAHAGAAGLRRPAEVETYADGETLDVPGRPRVKLTPGHSRGSCCLDFESRGVAFVGDAMCTLNVLTGRRGPQIPPAAFNDSSDLALSSLAGLESLEAEVLLFGHGEPWRDGARAAIARALDAGAS